MGWCLGRGDGGLGYRSLVAARSFSVRGTVVFVAQAGDCGGVTPLAEGNGLAVAGSRGRVRGTVESGAGAEGGASGTTMADGSGVRCWVTVPTRARWLGRGRGMGW